MAILINDDKLGTEPSPRIIEELQLLEKVAKNVIVGYKTISDIILKTGCSFTSKITKSIDIQRFLPGQKSSIYPFPV